MARRLAGLVGIVAGAGTPAGRSAAATLAADGMHLALTAATAEQARAAAQLVEAHRVECFPTATDVTAAAAARRLVAQTEQRLGPVDLLLVAVPPASTLRLLAAEVVPTMRARRRGLVVVADPALAEAADQLAADLTGGPVRLAQLPPGVDPATALHDVVAGWAGQDPHHQSR